MKQALARRPKNTPSTVLAANLAAYAAQAEGAFSPNTLRALLADQRVFGAFCDQHGVTDLPATPATVAAFVRAMAATKKPATIRRYLASIAHKHRAAQAPDPCKTDAVTLALKALHRAEGRAQKQAAPLRREHVVAALRARPRLSLRDLRQRAIIAVAYDSLCRASELVALRVNDITAADDGAATVLVRRAKNDPEGEGSVRFLRRDTMNHVRAWVAAASLTDGALFRAVLKGGRVGGPLHECEISRTMRELAPTAAGHVSAHSTRIGACQDLVKAGISMLAVMQAGGWKTAAMPAAYNRNQEAQTGGMAMLADMQDQARRRGPAKKPRRPA